MTQKRFSLLPVLARLLAVRGKIPYDEARSELEKMIPPEKALRSCRVKNPERYHPQELISMTKRHLVSAGLRTAAARSYVRTEENGFLLVAEKKFIAAYPEAFVERLMEKSTDLYRLCTYLNEHFFGNSYGDIERFGYDSGMRAVIRICFAMNGIIEFEDIEDFRRARKGEKKHSEEENLTDEDSSAEEFENV